MNKKIHIVFQVLNFLHSDHHLAQITTPAEHLVLINLASHKGIKGICPSISLISKELKLDKRTVIRSIQRWEDLEVIEIQKNIGKRSFYILHIPCSTGDIEDTSSKNVTSDIHNTELVTFTTSTGDIHAQTGDIHAPIYNKKVTKEVTNKIYTSFDDDDDENKIESSFNEFWEAYPKKVAKRDALKAWKKNKLYEQTEKIVNDINMRKNTSWNTKSKQYIPNPATYLNGERWNDEVFTNNGEKKHVRPRTKGEESFSILKDIHHRAIATERAGNNQCPTKDLDYDPLCPISIDLA